MPPDRDSMLAHAKERATEFTKGFEIPVHWGELVELEEDGGEFYGRFRGKDTDKSKDPPREIFLFVDEHGDPCWMRWYYRLGQEIANVGIGDQVAIYRGADEPFTTKSGEERTAYTFAVVSEPSPEPLPAEEAKSQPADGDEFPY